MGATILDTQLNILNDSMKFILQIIDDGAIKEIKLEFIDVSAFYYVKDDENLRFEFYNREKVEAIQGLISQVENKWNQYYLMN